MGPTPTPTPTRTLGMHLSCNFVNVYTIAYRVQYTFTRVQYTFTRVHTRIPNVGVRVRVGVGPVEFQLYGTRVPVTVRLVA